jgi:hypothetical protein
MDSEYLFGILVGKLDNYEHLEIITTPSKRHTSLGG